jgi:CHAD domain-containing protein
MTPPTGEPASGARTALKRSEPTTVPTTLRRGDAALARPKRGHAVARAKRLALDPALTGEAALQRIGLTSLGNIARNEAAVLAGREDGVHQMRVAVRRLRATLSAFGKLLPRHQRHWASEELRWLADALGPARNLDVFESALLKPLRQDPDNPAALKKLALKKLEQAALRQRRAAYRDAVAAVRSTRFAALLSNLAHWFQTCGWHGGEDAAGLQQPIAALAGRALQRRWRVARKRSKGFGEQSAQQRHRLRIALKKLRYAAESLAPLYPSEYPAPFLRRVKRLQDDLGHANDVRVGHEIVSALAATAGTDNGLAEAGDRVLGWHEQRLAKSEPRLRKHLDELFEAEPFWHR